MNRIVTLFATLFLLVSATSPAFAYWTPDEVAEMNRRYAERLADEERQRQEEKVRERYRWGGVIAFNILALYYMTGKRRPSDVVDKRAVILKGAAVVCLSMLILPPYHYALREQEELLRTGYDWIFSLPVNAKIDGGQLVLQWLGVLLIAFLLRFAVRDE